MMHSRLLIFILLFTGLNSFAQVNADFEYIKKHKIKTAYLPSGNPGGGMTFLYDEQGRLYEQYRAEWYTGYVPQGDIFRSLFDSLGRPTAYIAYTVYDSLLLSPGSRLPRPNMITHFSYPSDSIEIEDDSAWNEYGQLFIVRNETRISHWKTVPAPTVNRPLFWPDRLLMSSITTRWEEIYTHSDTLSSYASIIDRKGWLTLEGWTMADNKIQCEILSDSYFGDSVWHVRNFTTYTLNQQYDTITSTYYRNVNRIDEPSNVYKKAPLISNGYYQTTKRFGRYHIKYNSFDTGWLKVKVKEPCRDYRFSLDHIYNREPDGLNHYETIKNYSESFGQKPVYTYWP